MLELITYDGLTDQAEALDKASVYYPNHNVCSESSRTARSTAAYLNITICREYDGLQAISEAVYMFYSRQTIRSEHLLGAVAHNLS
jgi:hypothetical protein